MVKEVFDERGIGSRSRTSPSNAGEDKGGYRPALPSGTAEFRTRRKALAEKPARGATAPRLTDEDLFGSGQPNIPEEAEYRQSRGIGDLKE